MYTTVNILNVSRRDARGAGPPPELRGWEAAALAAVLTAASLLAVPSLRAQRSAFVTTTEAGITVDGSLDEPAWESAPHIGELIQRQPNPGARPTEATRVTILNDENHLYIGVMAYDSEPDEIVAQDMTRDAVLRDEDSIEILLDTYGDQRNAYYFATTPAGALIDGLLYANGQSNLDWDAIWDVRTQRTSEGWSAEFAIPFKSLTFPTGRTRWGFNISRMVQRKQEESRWAGARLETQFFQVSEAGEIELDGFSQGIGLDVRPFTGGSWLHTSANDDNTVTGKLGLDLFYNVIPSLKLTATVNTDFGETEVDARQINLTRFSLLFPEKRSFFLEDAGVFSFSNTSVSAPFYLSPARAEVIPFFSRSVGLMGRKEVPIDFGVKLTGKVGRTDIGLLDVRTRDTEATPDRNFVVARVKQNLLQQSYIGAVFAQGNPGRDIASCTYGADLRLATSNFLGKARNLVFNVYAVRSENEGVTDRDLSYGMSLEYPNDLWDLEMMWRDIQENFNPALGFVPRSGLRVFRIGGRYSPRPKDFLGLQQIHNGVFYNRFERLDDGEVESWNLFFTIPADWHFKSGDALHAFFSPDIVFKRLFEPFPIAPGVVLDPGEYRFTRWLNTIATSGRRPLSATVRWSFGSYWSGDAHELQTTLTYKFPPRLSVSATASQTFARLPEGNFVARTMSSQLQYAVSPLLTFSSLTQYDNWSKNLGWQGRLRWTPRAGNDVFLVFHHGWIQDELGGYRFRPADSKMSAKMQYTVRF